MERNPDAPIVRTDLMLEGKLEDVGEGFSCVGNPHLYTVYVINLRRGQKEYIYFDSLTTWGRDGVKGCSVKIPARISDIFRPLRRGDAIPMRRINIRLPCLRDLVKVYGTHISCPDRIEIYRPRLFRTPKLIHSHNRQ